MPRKKQPTGRPKLSTTERRKREREIKKQQQQYYEQRVQAKENPKQAKKEKHEKSMQELSEYLNTLINHNFDQHILDRRIHNPHAPVLKDTMPNLQFALAFFNNRFYKEDRKYFLKAPSPKESTKKEKTEILNQILANYTMCIDIFKDIFISANVGTSNDTEKQRNYLKDEMFRKFLDNLDLCSDYINAKVKEVSKILITDYLDSDEFNAKYTHQPGILLSLYTRTVNTDTSVSNLYKNKQLYYSKLDKSLCLYGEDYAIWKQSLYQNCIDEQIDPKKLYSPQMQASLRKRIFLKTIADVLAEKKLQYKKNGDLQKADKVFEYEKDLKNVDHKDAIILTAPKLAQSKILSPVYQSEQSSAVFILQLYLSFLNYVQRKNTKLTSLSADILFIDNYSTQTLPLDDTLKAYKRYFVIYSLLFLFPRLPAEETLNLQEAWNNPNIDDYEDLYTVQILSEKICKARSIKNKIEYFSKILRIASFYANLCFFPENSFGKKNILFMDTDNIADIFEQINITKKVNIITLPTTSKGIEILNQICHFIILQMDTMTGFDANSFLLNFW